ncbi:reverse transcriptase domain-containing protein [Tanacetum coccineum]
MNAKDTIHVQTCERTKEEFAHFLELYPVPFEHSVMLPKRYKTIFDALDRYVRLNPFGYAKLTTFIVMCKAYGCEPSVDLFRGFFNSFHGDSIVPTNCHELLSKDNRWDTKYFGDKLPDNIYKNPFFQRLGIHPTSVRVFPGPILFMAGLKPSWEHEMAFRNFIYAKTDEDLSFLPKEPSHDFGTGSPSVSINTEPPIGDAEPVVQLVENTADSGDSPRQGEFVIHPGSKAARIKDRKTCKFKMFRKEYIRIESSTQHSSVNEFVVINIPEEDVEPKQIILDPDDQPMWENAKIVAPTPNSAIVQPNVDDNFVINSTHLKMILKNKFDGYLQADSHDHICEFLAICDMFKYGETQSEAVKLLIFPFSLCDEAKTWFNELNEESITSWEQMRRAFINRFFPPSLFNRLLLEIINFS